MSINGAFDGLVADIDGATEGSPALPVITVTGINHRSADINVRERLCCDVASYPRLLQRFRQECACDEAVIVSTCNRFELVAAGPRLRGERAVSLGAVTMLQQHQVVRFLESISGLDSRHFLPSVYSFENSAAVRHVFRVAAGLDSMVLGEPQILGQLKQAFSSSQQIGATKALLNKLFHHTFHVAKAVRSKTAISSEAVSICYLARELALQIFGDLTHTTVLIIGSGETGTLASKHFESAGVRKFYVANRTLPHALELAETLSGTPLTLSGLPEFLSTADIIVGAASLGSNDTPLITASEVRRAMRERRSRSQLFIDLGVPRNFEPTIGELAQAFLYNIDDLQSVARQNMDRRILEAERAELIVEEEVNKFQEWLERRTIEPLIKALVERCSGIATDETDKTLRRLKREGFSASECEKLQPILQNMTEALLAKFVHQPITQLKKEAIGDETIAEAFRALFSLGSPTTSPAPGGRESKGPRGNKR